MMHIEYNDTTFNFDLEDVTTEQLVKIYKVYGLDFTSLAEGMQRGNIDALRAIYWLMQVQNGSDLLRLETVTIEKPAKFVIAILNALVRERQEALEAEEKKAAAEKASPKAKAAPKE